MESLEALHTRNSVALLQEPGPDKMQLENIFQAGLRACDHRQLRPWKFLVVEGKALTELGELMLEIRLQENPDLSAAEQKKIVSKPLRAPAIVIVVAAVKTEHFGKVPLIEQLLSAGAAAQMMMAAAHSQGVGAIWRTGSIAFNAAFRAGLGLSDDDQIVGMLYMGTPKAVKPLRPLHSSEYVQFWSR